jgi:hypothetical protein
MFSNTIIHKLQGICPMLRPRFFLYFILPKMLTVIFCLLFVSGCVSSPQITVNPLGNQSQNTSTNLPSAISTLLDGSQGSDRLAKNTTIFTKEPVIILQPIPDSHIGNIITFQGTTNLALGELIHIDIHSAEYQHCAKHRPCPDSVKFCCEGIQKNETVILGDNGVNTFSWVVNTSQHEFEPGRYSFSAYSLSDPIEKNTFFTLN